MRKITGGFRRGPASRSASTNPQFPKPILGQFEIAFSKLPVDICPVPMRWGRLHLELQRRESRLLSLRSSCRPAALARMRSRVGAANAAGLPVEIRYGLLQRSERGVAALRGHAEVFRAHARPQTSSHATLSDIRRSMQNGRVSAIPRGGRTRWRDFGRLRSNSSSKLRCVGRRRRGLDSLSRCRRQLRTLTGRPMASAAPTPWRIRAGDPGRHERCNRQKCVSFLESTMPAPPCPVPKSGAPADQSRRKTNDLNLRQLRNSGFTVLPGDQKSKGDSGGIRCRIFYHGIIRWTRHGLRRCP
jgi:hypothetical protein